jgi:hypothetical protein
MLRHVLPLIAFGWVAILAPGGMPAYAQAETCGNAAGAARTTCLWNLHFNRGDFTRALSIAQQFKTELDRAGKASPVQLAQALMAIGKPALSLGRLDVAKAAFSEALSLPR